MKKKYMILIVLLLIILVGAYILSPYSPLNKVTVNGETIKLTSGYTSQYTKEDSLTIANDTNELTIYYNNSIDDVNTAINNYKDKYGERYNITNTKLETDNGAELIKTDAVYTNGTITKYWFVHDGTVYNIQTRNDQPDTEIVVKDIISSMK
jgi:hypothetical protein